jgi:hypothetical protein
MSRAICRGRKKFKNVFKRRFPAIAGLAFFRSRRERRNVEQVPIALRDLRMVRTAN